MRSGQLVAERYRLEELIGSGGMGLVWRAVDTELGRVVAVKQARPGQGGPGAEWLRREARNAARVHHPNAVTLFDAVVEDTDCWLVMEYVAAESLAALLDRKGPLDLRSAARIGAQVAAALAAMHAGGVVHRDVKPGNVLVTEDGLAKLTDFGISRWAEETLTQTGPVPGTPAYQAPEVASGWPANEASDVYSLGATLFAMVEGEPPSRHGLGTRPPDVPATDATTSFAAVLDGLLALDPARRPTAEAARRMLDAVADGVAVPASTLAPAVETRAAPAHATVRAPTPRQLPAAPRLFTGRQNELARLTATMDTAGGRGGVMVISAIGGSGGIGKTWLAVRWAHENLHRFPDGQLYVNLNGFDPASEPLSPAAAVRGFLEALGVGAAAIPVDPQARVGLYRSLVAGRRMLIVLDNARDTAQVTPLLPGDSACVVLVTSRNQLGGLVTAHGAEPLALDVLTDDEARQLLTRHVGAARVAAEPAAATELLDLCAGLPLAIGIVAARAATTPALSLATLADELRDRSARLDTISTGELATNLRQVFTGSYHALTDDGARVFRLLGLAQLPEVSAAAAANLAGVPVARTRGPLRELEAAYLVQQHAPGRYRMHDLVRLYAHERARHEEPEHADALRRLVDFYLHTTYAAARLLYPHMLPVTLDPPVAGSEPEQLADATAALRWFETEHACLTVVAQHAAQHGWDSALWQCAWSAHTFRLRRGHLQDNLEAWLAGVAAADRVSSPAVRACARLRLAQTLNTLGHHEEARDHLARGLALAEAAGDGRVGLRLHTSLAETWAQQGDNREALTHATQAFELSQTLDNPRDVALALSNLGWYQAQLGQYDDARDSCETALALNRELSLRDSEAPTLDSLGYIAHHTGAYHDALGYYQEALDLAREIGNGHSEAEILDHIGETHAALHQPAQARQAWQRAVELFRAQHRLTRAGDVERRLLQLSRVDDG